MVGESEEEKFSLGGKCEQRAWLVLKMPVGRQAKHETCVGGMAALLGLCAGAQAGRRNIYGRCRFLPGSQGRSPHTHGFACLSQPRKRGLLPLSQTALSLGDRFCVLGTHAVYKSRFQKWYRHEASRTGQESNIPR
jgi:hypothetical protein